MGNHWHSPRQLPLVNMASPCNYSIPKPLQSRSPKLGTRSSKVDDGSNFLVPKQTQIQQKIRPCYGPTEKPSSLDLHLAGLHEADDQLRADRCQGTIQPGMKRLMSINHGSPGFLMQTGQQPLTFSSVYPTGKATELCLSIFGLRRNPTSSDQLQPFIMDSWALKLIQVR